MKEVFVSKDRGISMLQIGIEWHTVTKVVLAPIMIGIGIWLLYCVLKMRSEEKRGTQ